MGIVGDHPEGGIRFDLERVTEVAPWVYAGSAFTRDAEHRLRASVDLDGAVVVEDEAKLPKEVVQRAKMLLRTAYRHGAHGPDSSGAAPPRRLHRWRAG
jgi:hypothetical protein